MQKPQPPKRVVLRLHDQHEHEEAAIRQKYFALYGPEPIDDYYHHLTAPNNSHNMHIVFDLGCRTNPAVDCSKICYEVYKVRKMNDFYFEKLPEAACEVARERCRPLIWGTDRNYPEELEGDRPEQVGHSPATLVS